MRAIEGRGKNVEERGRDDGPQGGADVLHNVGKILHAKQGKATEELTKATREMAAANKQLGHDVAFENQFRAIVLDPDWREYMREHYDSVTEQIERGNSAYKPQTGVQQTLKNIGSVNKEMRKRMMKDFMPRLSDEAFMKGWPKKAGARSKQGTANAKRGQNPGTGIKEAGVQRKR